MRKIVKYLDASIDEAALRKDLLGTDSQHSDTDFTGRVLTGEDAA